MKASSNPKNKQLDLFEASSEFEQRHKELVELINKYDHAYYHDNMSIVSDAEYDKLYQELELLEVAYPQFVTPDSPTQRVAKGFGLSLAKVNHFTPMLSIKTETDYSRQAAIKFDQSIRRLLYLKEDSPSPEYITELKYDGLSMNLIYWDGKLSSAATRGDGEVGEDVTYNFCKLANIPTVLPFAKDTCIEIRGEAVMLDSDFNDLNDQLKKLGKPTLSTARHAASATVRRLTDDGTIRRLVFLPYGVGYVKNIVLPDKQSDLLLYLKTIGFDVNTLFSVCKSAEELADFHEEINDRRVMLAYGIDGVVYKLNSRDLQAQLGYSSRQPKWAVAHKYKADLQITRLLDIQLEIARTGKLTPVGILEPTDINGVVITKCSLHNLFDLRKRNVRIGDFVMVQRAGDVIPEILPVKKANRKIYHPNFRMPKTCPCCNGQVVRPKGQVHYYCINHEGCSEQLVQKNVYFFSKPNMYVPGLGVKTIEDIMLSTGKKKPIEFYELSKHDLLKIGYTEKTAETLFKNIEKSMKTSLKRFISALGLPGIGSKVAEDIANKFFSNHEEFSTNTYHDLVDMLQKQMSKTSVLSKNYDVKSIVFDYVKPKFNFTK